LASPVCPLCRQRKGKRYCPAKGENICASCCGTKRRIEIDCPSDCAYLTGEHAPGWEGRETERRRDLRRVAPHLQDLSEGQARLFFLALLGFTGIRARRPETSDERLAQAVSALRKTVETRERGILYEHQAEDLRAQGLVFDLRSLFESKDQEGQPVSPDDRDLLPVLTALERSLAAARQEDAGPYAFLETAARLAAQFASTPEAPTPRPLVLEP
jgi:hypothetical protein